MQQSFDGDGSVLGYYLPEHAQDRLQKLGEHVRFLARIAEPRTRAEEQSPQLAIRMDELALCLELLAEQVRLILDEARWPATLHASV
ncbi:hypothetical protein KIP31_16070 [Xanthomonas campestris pv. campestris]|uniref:XAC0095 family protein n=1 Tax=Xanthomonas campestris TaxID=339 RepID=UPI001F31A65D|nr:hypothetical protein [Xanthomonas campestris]MCF8810801.1 hypothetical protein [Xanthomonas campestris pv. campestris]